MAGRRRRGADRMGEPRGSLVAAAAPLPSPGARERARAEHPQADLERPGRPARRARGSARPGAVRARAELPAGRSAFHGRTGRAFRVAPLVAARVAARVTARVTDRGTVMPERDFRELRRAARVEA